MNYFDALAPCPNTPGKLTECSSCLNDGQCGFDRSDFKCKLRAKMTRDQGVFDVSRCKLVEQMQKVGHLYPVASATWTDDHLHVQVFPNNGPSTAGVIPANIKKTWDDMREHVFNGVANPTTQKERDSGRHLKSTWLQTHPGAQPLAGESDASVHLLKYPFVRPVFVLTLAY